MSDAHIAFQRYWLTTQPDGRIAGETETNDNLDRGYPSEYAKWQVEFSGLEQLKTRTGLTHVGCSGIEVEVVLDGKLLHR